MSARWAGDSPYRGGVPTETPDPVAIPDPVDWEAVKDSVRGRRPADAREREAQASFLERVEHLARPADEFSDPVHVTASAILVTPDRRRVLLHRHKRLGLWLQPGGHIDAGEQPWEAARREAAEETGLEATLVSTDLVHVDVHPGPRRHTHLDLRYLVEAPHVTPTPPEGESPDAEWFPWYRAIAMADAGLAGVLRLLQPGEARIRTARGNDAGDIAEVYLRSRAFALPGIPVVHDAGSVRRWFADEVVGRSDTWVAEVDGVVVGMMVLDHARDGSWIEQLYLDPTWMGRGLGDRMMEIAVSRAHGALQLWTFEANGPARRFYARHGFVEVEHTDGRGNEERAPDVRLVRPL